MAIRIAMNVVCDRCMKPYQQKTLEYGEAVPKVDRENLVVLRESEPDEAGEVKQNVLFAGKDFCPRCQKVIDKAIQTIRMDPPPKPKKKRNGVKTSVKPEEGEPKAEPEPEPEAEPEPAKEAAAEESVPETPPEEESPPPEDKPEEEDEHLF